MRKITTDSANAFLAGENFKSGNTEVRAQEVTCPTEKPQEYKRSKFYLHNSVIAKINLTTNILQITNAGYFTQTTKERLNGILKQNVKHGINIKTNEKVSVYKKIVQRGGEWFITNNLIDGTCLDTGKEWNGEWITI